MSVGVQGIRLLVTDDGGVCKTDLKNLHLDLFSDIINKKMSNGSESRQFYIQ